MTDTTNTEAAAQVKDAQVTDRATARKETEWFVEGRRHDGFEVASDEDAEWKCIARNEEIGQQISDAVNSYTASQKRIEALEAALGQLAVDILQGHTDSALEFVRTLEITSAPDCTPRAALTEAPQDSKE